MVFPGVMYGCETWMIKKAECQMIDMGVGALAMLLACGIKEHT